MPRAKMFNDALSGAIGQCPVPGCKHVCRYYTKHHAETVHGMTREEIFEIYGQPQRLLNRPRKGSLSEPLGKKLW